MRGSRRARRAGSSTSPKSVRACAPASASRSSKTKAVRLQVEDAKAEVARIDAQRAMSARQLERIEKLANNSISQTQLDEVRSQLAMLTAQLQQAQVRHRAAQHDLEQTELRAPFPGIVTERLAQRGEYVATGAAIAHLVDTVHLEARVQAPLKLVDLVKPAMELPVKVGRAGSSRRSARRRSGRRSALTAIRAAPDAGEQCAERRRPIEVGLPEREAADALVVPRDAIAVRQDGDYLMRVRADNTAERVAVTSVATDGDLVTDSRSGRPRATSWSCAASSASDGQRVTILTRDAALRRGGGGNAGAR